RILIADASLLVVGVWFAAFVLVGRAASPEAVDFARDIRPLFEQHCFKCHGPEKQKGGLRFDSKAGAFKTAESGEKAIIPGHGSDSRLIKLVASAKDEERMPSKGEPLSASQIDLLKRWIDAGAAWPESGSSTGSVARAELIVTDADRKHWSYLPLQSPPPPKVKNSSWPRTPVDRFV